MRTIRPTGLVLSICLVAGTVLSAALAQAPNRVSEHVDDGQRFVLPASVHPKTRIATDIGSADSAMTLPVVTIHLAISPSQQQKLQTLLTEQQDKKSPQYHKWLTPEQFGEQFGASAHDVNQVTQWLKDKGFENVKVARGRTFVTASGTAAKAQEAFNTQIHMYQLDSNLRYANSTPASVPRAFENLVLSVSGLNSFRPQPRAVPLHRHLTSDQTGNHFVTPGDFATIYDLNPLYAAGINGSGVKIAIAGQTDIDVTQVNTFRSLSALSANTPTVMNLTGHSVSTADQGEAYLDVEWAGAVAPNATVVYVNADNVNDAETYIVDNNVAPVMSITYGICEAQDNVPSGQILSDNQTFQQATAEGMTVTAASGDFGAADCDDPTSAKTTTPTTASLGLAVDFPSSSPYVTGVGGTMFNDATGSYWGSGTSNSAGGASALSYIPETAWNETATNQNIEGASGGGASLYFPKPNWQTGTGVPNDNARDVPDVALNSAGHDGTIVCSGGTDCTGTNSNGDGFRASDGTFDVVSGTSVAAPSFAGIVALLVQQAGGPQGNINPRLYQLASSSTDAFHDITTGNNEVPCTSGTPNCPASGEMGFVATQGYDQATGLGSVDADHFVNEWSPNFTMLLSPTSLTLAASSSGTSTLSVAAVGNFTSSLSLTCKVSSALTSTTCTVPATVSPGSSVTVTVANGNKSLLAPWRKHTPGGRWPWAALALGGLAMAFWPRSRKRILKTAFATACLSVALACGSGSTGSSTGTGTGSSGSGGGSTVNITGTVTITATGGGITNSASLSVTDQ